MILYYILHPLRYYKMLQGKLAAKRFCNTMCDVFGDAIKEYARIKKEMESPD